MSEQLPQIKRIDGGVTAPKGFRAAGVHCGIRKNHAKKDLALIAAQQDCTAAAVYTQNKVKGAPLAVTRRHLANGHARAVVCNSGNANTCNADGEEIAEKMCTLAAAQLGIGPEDVLVASTGVIGEPLSVAPIEAAMPALTAALSPDGSGDANDAIMTTDTVRKEAAVELKLGGVPCRIGGIAKGSGMIHPNMATMLSFLTTDAAVEPEALHAALLAAVRKTFNMVSVDGDTSTNDMVVILASGAADGAEITAESADYDDFRAALETVCTALCRLVAGDGEGASKLLTCTVTGAPDEETARAVSKSVITSSLFKAAMFGGDANWGRVLCAIGYAPASFDITKTAVAFSSENGRVAVCARGVGVPFSEEKAAEVLKAGEITAEIDLNAGCGEATAWGCDLTYDYVRINGEYRS